MWYIITAVAGFAAGYFANSWLAAKEAKAMNLIDRLNANVAQAAKDLKK